MFRYELLALEELSISFFRHEFLNLEAKKFPWTCHENGYPPKVPSQLTFLLGKSESCLDPSQRIFGAGKRIEEEESKAVWEELRPIFLHFQISPTDLASSL